MIAVDKTLSTLRQVWKFPRLGLVLLVRLYQIILSPLIGRHCRFVPTCSNYFIEALEKRGAVHGALLGLWRIMRCHPFGKGGYDPVRRESGGGCRAI